MVVRHARRKVQLRVEIGTANHDSCWVDPAWCMLYSHDAFPIIPLGQHRTFPGYIAYP
jgi:hypothetical protein